MINKFCIGVNFDSNIYFDKVKENAYGGAIGYLLGNPLFKEELPERLRYSFVSPVR